MKIYVFYAKNMGALSFPVKTLFMAFQILGELPPPPHSDIHLYLHIYHFHIEVYTMFLYRRTYNVIFSVC